jgi:hypothetical protein
MPPDRSASSSTCSASLPEISGTDVPDTLDTDRMQAVCDTTTLRAFVKRMARILFVFRMGIPAKLNVSSIGNYL